MEIANKAGRATMLVGGADVGKVDWTVRILERNGLREGGGQIRASADALFKAFTAGAAQLVLAGGNADIVVTGMDNGDGAPFKLSGPWPGL